MHLSKRELEAIANTNKGEWDAEFTRFLNVAIPFDRCVAHVGSEGWGPNSRSFGDLQVRVYDIDGPGVGLEDQIVKAAKETVKPNGIRRYPTNNGTRLIIGYPRTHFDYVGSAEVRFEIRRYKDRTIVFVFMTMTNHASEIREILESIRVDPAK
jgi:hypothetical protein